MNRRIFAILATAFTILPLGVNAAQNNLQNNDTQILPMSSNQLARDGSSHGKGRGNREGRFENVLKELDLTTEQSEQINNIREQSRTENEALHQEMQANREQMKSLFSSDVSVEQLRQQHQQSQALRQQLGNNRFEMMLQIREVLTPEQRSQIEAMRQKR